MEYDPFVSRRDSATNALIGIFLLVVFFACLAAIALVCWLGFTGSEWILRRIFPHVTYAATFSSIGIWTWFLVWTAVGHGRKRRWRNAFLFLAVAPITGWIFMVPMPPSIGGIGGNWVLYCWLPLIMVIGIAGDASMGRPKFFLAAAIVGAVAALNSGLLGYTALSSAAAYCLVTGTLVWWCIDIIRIRRKTETADPSMALPPAGA